ncbi:MAG: acyl-CoA dehydrogenase family protein, partial [Sphingobium sp.]
MQTMLSPADADVTGLLDRIAGQFDALTVALAQRCARDGALDGTALDDHQVASYELAFASSELLAARTLLAAAGMQPGTLQHALSAVFAADAVPSALTRMEAIAREIGADVAPIVLIRTDPAYAAMLAAGGTATLEDAGVRLEQGHEPFAEVDAGEDVAMARDSFRRFAADVVAPLAEQIHRHDMTVPESLLQPMREMGVFGLSVPARFGGSAPDEGEDNLTMIAITEALSEASLAAAGSLITRPEILTRA